AERRDALWRLLLDPDRQSARQHLADRRAERAARIVPDADRALGPALEAQGLWPHARQSRRHRRDRRGNPGTGGRRNPPAPRGVEARAAHRHPPSAGTAATRLIRLTAWLPPITTYGYAPPETSGGIQVDCPYRAARSSMGWKIQER